MNRFTLRVANRTIAGILVVLLAAPLAMASPQQTQDSQQPAQTQQPAQSQQQPAQSQQQPAQPEQQPAQPQQQNQPQLVDRAAQPNNAETDQEKSGSGKPVGTAAAPATKPTGVAGSRPAGAVIAPAKQRRVRTILIRVGVIVGAGVAVGTVAALSRGSSSRP